MSRTLLVQHWTFHTAKVHEAKRQDFEPVNLNGADLLEFAAEQLQDLQLTDREKGRWTAVQSVQRMGKRSLLVTAAAGSFNEPGDVVDVSDGTVPFTLGTNHAATAPTRSLLIIPDAGIHAVAFYERSTGRGTSGLDLLRAMQQKWRELGAGVTWASEWLEEADAWLAAANLKAVHVRRYVGDANTASPDAEDLGEFLFGARATKNHYLPHLTLEQILVNPRKAHSLIGHGLKHEDGDRVFLELAHNGTQKTYALDGGKLPKVQMALKDELTDTAFVGECINQARDRVFSGMGVQWRPEWVASA